MTCIKRNKNDSKILKYFTFKDISKELLTKGLDPLMSKKKC